MRLKKLRAKGCRGILDGPDLQFGKDGVVLVGDNGTGKSSYIDALEKVLTGRCGSLDTGDQGLSWSKQGRHVASKPGPEIELILTDGSKDFSVTQQLPDVSGSAAVAKMLGAACRQSFLLRRRTLLAFINAKPADRYRAVAEFLRLDQFNSFEGKLKVLLTTCRGRVAATKAAMQVEEASLRQRLTIPSTTAVTNDVCLNRVNTILREAGVTTLESLDEGSVQTSRVVAEVTADTNLDELQKVYLLKSLVLELPAPEHVSEAAEKYAGSRRSTLAEERKLSGRFYESVLEQGLEWIREKALPDCPLCEHPIDPTGVSRRIEARLHEHRTLASTRRAQEVARRSFVSALTSMRNHLRRLEAKWLNALTTAFPSPAQELAGLLESAEARHATLQSAAVIEADRTTLASAKLTGALEALASAIEANLARHPSAHRYESLATAKLALDAGVVGSKRFCDARARLLQLETAQSQIQRIVDLAEKARKAAVQQLLDQIATRADEYFRAIHPGERIGSPALKVTDRGTASIDLTCVFHDQPGDPRGCYSEGHVDSLGLCIFLAIRRYHHETNGELSLLVLDDVLHSVDGEHRMATAKLILKEFADHQIVITTHDPLWFENLKAVARVAGRSFLYHRIADWSLSTGPVWGDHLSDYEWLTSPESATAQTADRVIKAGRLLEQMLQNLCDSLAVAVPFSLRGRYTMEPLWTSFLPRAKKNKEFYAAAADALDKIEELRGLRNLIGAHYNQWAGFLTASESKELTDAIMNLREHVYCSTCCEFIKRIAGLDGVWSCKKEHLRFKG